MNAKEYVSLWFKGITDAEKIVKKLEKGKIKSREGFISVGLFSLIIGLIFSVLTIPFSKTIQSTAVILVLGLIILPFASMIGLGIFSAILNWISKKIGGKTDTSKIIGLFGIIFPMVAIASIPAVLVGFLGALTRNLSIYYIAMAAGVFISSVAGSIVNAVMLQSLSGVQKTSLPKAGMVYGATVGVLMAVFFIIMAFLIGLVPTASMM